MIKMQNVRKVYPGFDFELSMEIPEGRITGLIGKNGAGKSTAIRLMLGLAKADGGIIELFGKPITEIMAEDRQNIGVSLAESGFNGQFTIVEVEKILAKMYPKFEESWFTRECQKLHLPEGKQFKEFSNGMKAKLRVLTALSHKAQLLILDEPTAGLDVEARNEILDLLREIKNKINGSIMLITHDLGVIAEMADYVVVMYAGKVIERGTALEIFQNPLHPYTMGLQKSKPAVNKKVERLYNILGQVPNPVNMPSYCYFKDRCDKCIGKCNGEYPPMIQVTPTHSVSCYLYNENKKEGE